MGRAFILFLGVGWVTGCGGEANGSKAADAGGSGGSSSAGTGGKQGGAAGLEPPPAQGAFWVNVKSVSPAPAGKMCPSGASLTFDLPAVDPTTNPPQSLDADTYVHNLIDGEDAAEVKCAVQGASSYALAATIKLGTKAFTLAAGSLAANKKGTAQISLQDSGTPGFSGVLSSASANCTLDAAAGAGTNFQIKAGSVWASFSCPAVEHAPSDYCQASGYFVLENCEQ